MFAFVMRASGAVYYVDYGSGSDSNPGTSNTAPWKHCPGDAAASSTAAGISLVPGDTVLFKGGVTYVLTASSGIALRWNGLPGNPIVYDGNSAGTWGTGRAIVTNHNGFANVTAFSASSAASHLAFKHLDIAAIGGSASLPPDTGTAAASRFGGGLAFTQAGSDITIDGCVFRSFGYAFNQKPMSAASLAGSAITLRQADSVTIKNCDFSRMTIGIDMNTSASLTNVKVSDCTFHDSVVWPIEVPVNNMAGVSVTGCSESNNAQFDRSAWTGYGESPRISIRDIPSGGSITLNASALALPSANFQWQRNGQPIAGATSSTLMLTGVTSSQAGTYTVVASNSAGASASHEVVLNVTGGSASDTAPVFTLQPLSQTVAPFSTVTLSVAASGSPAPTYQWYRNGLTYTGWSGPTLTISGISTNDAGTYVAVASNSFGAATSNGAVVAVSTEPVPPPPAAVAPVFTLQPLSQTAAASSTVTFTVAASGSPAPTFQWFRNGAVIVGGTSATLILPSISSSDVGSYVAVAANSAGSVTSNVAMLTLETTSLPPSSTDSAPIFTVHPLSQTAAPFSTVTLTVAATGSPAPTFKWFRNGVTYTGWTGTTLTISGISTNDAGIYHAIATNSAGFATSQSATITVSTEAAPPPPPPPSDVAPVFTLHPLSQTAAAGSTVAFTVAASGSPTPTLQWLRNGVVMVGGTGATLTLPSISSSDVGSYTAVATNSAGSATSNVALLTLQTAPLPPPPSSTDIAPVFTTHPLSQTVAMRSTVTLSAAATGSPAPAFQWFRNGVTFSGWTGSTLTLVDVSKNDEGVYTVTATNSAGTTKSNAATLTVVPRPKAGPTVSAALAETDAPAFDPDAAPRLVNLSVRANAGSGDESLIVGFVVAGDSVKSLLIRGSGPALSSFGIPRVLDDPTLSVYSGSNVVASNDDWSKSGHGFSTAAAGAKAGAFTLTDGSLDSALLTEVPAGAYTGQLSSKDGGSGMALIELYDTTSESNARLANVSVRTMLTTTGESPIIGFVVSGSAPKKLLIRAVGPTLGAFGVAGALADPQIEIYEGAQRLQQNDNWGGSSELISLFAQAGAFAFDDTASKDAALLVTAPPGAYSAVVSSNRGENGIVLIEVYELP